MRRFSVILAALFVLAALPSARSTGVSASSHADAPLAKKKCKTVTKKVHGKKVKRRVCTTVKTKRKPAPTATSPPISTPTATSTPEGANQVSHTPAFPGAAPGGFIAGISTRVSVSSSLLKLARVTTGADAGQTKGSSEMPGGVNIDSLHYSSFTAYQGKHSDIGSFSTMVGDATGFTVGQLVCVKDRATGETIGCSPVKRVAPAPSTSFPNAATISLDDFPVIVLSQLDSVKAPIKAVLVCMDVAVRFSSGSSSDAGTILHGNFTTPTGPKPLHVAVRQVVDGVTYLTDLIPTLGGDPSNPQWIGNIVVPPGLQFTVDGTVQGRASSSRTRLSFNPMASYDSATKAWFLCVLPFDSSATVANCPQCQIQNGTLGGIPYVSIFNPNATPSFWQNLQIDVNNVGDPSDPFLDVRDRPLDVILSNSQPEYVGEFQMTALKLEPVFDRIQAEFVQGDEKACEAHTGCITYYKAISKDQNGNTVEPFDLGGDSLTFHWFYSAKDEAGNPIPGAMDCGVRGPDGGPTWSWWHPAYPLSNCSHTSPYHPGLITLLVSDGNYNCIATYPYGSRGDAAPEFGDQAKCVPLVG